VVGDLAAAFLYPAEFIVFDAAAAARRAMAERSGLLRTSDLTGLATAATAIWVAFMAGCFRFRTL
jgi:hypothetical protein